MLNKQTFSKTYRTMKPIQSFSQYNPLNRKILSHFLTLQEILGQKRGEETVTINQIFLRFLFLGSDLAYLVFLLLIWYNLYIFKVKWDFFHKMMMFCPFTLQVIFPPPLVPCPKMLRSLQMHMCLSQ